MGWYHSALLSCYHHLNRKKKLKKSIVMPDCDFVENEKKTTPDWGCCVTMNVVTMNTKLVIYFPILVVRSCNEFLSTTVVDFLRNKNFSTYLALNKDKV